MEKKKAEIFTIANAHLDTSWLWTLEQTVEEYIPDTLNRNFELLSKYPEYKFNFEGSYRYELIKEYYPEAFEKIKEYVKEGRWNPCGACYENGDVNIPSPEALIRNVVYGNGFFKKEFGTESNDIFLPDCFGFGRVLPTVAAHCGIKGFSTSKLFWGSSVPIPFNTGKWLGIDGQGVWASLMPFSYTTVFKKPEKATRVNKKLQENKDKNLPAFTLAYHGIGDRGGAPHKASVKNIVNAQRKNPRSDINIYSSTTKEFFDKVDALPQSEKDGLPVYDGELLLTAHGAGSYTSRTVTKRWNRRCELLADACERFATAAFVSGFSDYPSQRLDQGWKKVIAHQFHDDITGTSFEECYKRNHNDYVQAMNAFSDEYTAACKSIADDLDTSFVKGIPIVVSNPLQASSVRKDAVSVTLKSNAEHFRVFDQNGVEVPSQMRTATDGKKEIIFIAEVLSCGLTVYDLRESDRDSTVETNLRIDDNTIENKYLKITINENGDISSVFDKRLNKELLSAPVRQGIYNNVHSFDWPAWEIRYEDVAEPPYAYPRKVTAKIKDCGNALCSFEIVSRWGKSQFRQIVSLSSESEYVSIYNETDWREEASLLKAEFSLTASNENAVYDIGIGGTKRATNTKSLYEVPAQKWADITDEKSGFGVSIFSDSRAGWDKPDNSALRLTLVHTPMANYRWECSQHIMDMGLNRYSFAVMGHGKNDETVTAFADSFCQPMHTFIAQKHSGKLGREYSFARINDDRVRVMAIKKAQESDKAVLRVCESSGNSLEGIEVGFSLPVIAVYEITGDEKIVKKMNLTNGSLRFDIGANSIRSFAVEFEKIERTKNNGDAVALKFNATGITDDNSRNKSTLKGEISVPRELVPHRLLSGGVEFLFSPDDKNCIACDGGEIRVGSGYESVHLLLTSLGGDKKVKFGCGEKAAEVTVPDCFEALGHWDLLRTGETGYIKPIPKAFTFSHTHGKNGNLTAKQFYVFSVEIPLCGSSTVKLPVDDDIVVFAATAVKKASAFLQGDNHFDTLAKRSFDYEFSDYAQKLMKPNLLEKFLNRFLDRTFTLNIRTGEFYNKYALNELYYILRNLSNKLSYKKNVEKLLLSRKK